MFLSISLKHYKKPEVMNTLVQQGEHKEIGVMFGIGKFGKRPDILHYPNDILEFAKKKVTSFHCSEENWQDPLSLSSDIKRKDLNNMRLGWDFILDIDCPVWELSKLTTHLFIEVLKRHKIKGITCKFSGNKGFHIAVPFESFPKTIIYQDEIVQTKDFFPEFPKLIAKYILDYVESELIKIKDNKVSFIDKTYSFEELRKLFKLSFEELTYKKCSKCGRINKTNDNQKYEYLCNSCGFTTKKTEEKDFIKCPKCNSFMTKTSNKTAKGCICGSNEVEQRLNLSKVIEVDTILISSRHMYRMPYSLHEKSGLVSIPIKTEEVLSFDKDRAKPENVKFGIPFLERKVKLGEGLDLLEKSIAFDNRAKTNIEIKQKVYQSQGKTFEDYEIDQEAIPEEFFPPCIKNMHKGIEDGRKRIMFSLINFLNSLNWSFDKIDEYVHEWNKTNEEALRETLIKTQINYRRKQDKILPPNCDTEGYYKDLGVCTPDPFCSRIKNPVQYAKLKAKMNKKGRRGRKKKVVVEKKEVKEKPSTDKVNK